MKQLALRDRLARHAVAEGLTETPIEGLKLFRVSHPIERLPAVYPASLCVIAQGQKRAYLGGEAYTYDAEHYLCATMPLPVEAEVPHATPTEPVLGLLLDLETREVVETLVAYEAAARPLCAGTADAPPSGLAVIPVDDAFASAVARLLDLLEDPVALRVLAGSRLRELLFLLIDGKAGPLVRGTLGGGHELMRALTYVREHLGEPISIDELARRAGMSRAVFYRRFKAATCMSPLQFIKAMRLSHAAMQIVAGRTVSEAARCVGYRSASQFSREFRRHFGASPKQWARRAAVSGPDVQAQAA